MAAKPGLGTLGEFPRLRLCRLPTPLEAMPNLGEALGGAGVYVKRDDCTDLAFGGNKVRQLEFYLGEARLQGADTILITGAVQSNFVRLAAAAARKSGMDCHIQLEERVPRDDPLYRNSGNVLLDRILGATLYSYPEGEDEEGADRRVAEIADGTERAGKASLHHPSRPGDTRRWAPWDTWWRRRSSWSRSHPGNSPSTRWWSPPGAATPMEDCCSG